ncbi:MAG TPA: nucleotidyl transferase AbiEii/AbiGii toxin family protein [Solirubrobacterales bacterium]|nr:nucleotidyl transferase AbiEii/AbiGii toxin family protein [Solirubrobacterales bacterium]
MTVQARVDQAAGEAFRALQAKARAEHRGDTQALLTVYAVESFLRRLSMSDHANQMVLKGGMLMAVSNIRRMTRDADLSTHGMANDEESVRSVVTRICALEPDPHDGVAVDTATIRTELMREEDEYRGVRCKLVATLGKAQIPFALDFSFGDPDESTAIELESVIDLPPVRLEAYPLALNLAEKIVTAMQRRETSTRDRDFADLWVASRHHRFAAPGLRRHILAVAAHRRQSVMPMAVALANMPDRQASYAAMVERMSYLSPPPKHWTSKLSIQRRRIFRSLWATALAMLVAISAASTAHAAEAGWSFNPASWDFGTIVPGTGPTPPKAFTLTNTGEVELQPIFVSIGSEAGGGFSLAGNTCGKLAPDADCAISVTFDPSSAGPMQGQLSVASQGGLVPPAAVELSGTGAGPAVSITPAKQTFDPLQLDGGPSAPRTFTIANEGQLDLIISSISIQTNTIYNYPGAAVEQFEFTGGTCKVGVAVPPGFACTVAVTFSPTAPGALSAQLRIADNAPGAAHVADLEGFGIAPPWQPPLPPPFIAPSVSIAHRPARRTTSRSAVFWLHGSPTAARFACKLDESPFRVCESPVRYRGLGDGRHRFAVRAFDGNGRWGESAEFRWRIPRRSR